MSVKGVNSGLFQFLQEEEKPQKEITPSFAEVLTQAMDAKLYDMRVAMPGTVVKYDSKKQAVDVQPSLKAKHPDGGSTDLPVVYSVPIVFMRGGDASFTFPIKKGDSVLLIFADRSIDKWLSNGGSVDPEDTRKHDLSDAIAIPGLSSFKNPVPVENLEEVTLRNKNMEIRLSPNGKIKIKNGSTDLIAAMTELAEIVKNRHPEASSAYAKIKSFKAG